MKLHNQFLRLHSHYGGSEDIQVTLDELASTLQCTHRNASTIIRKMSEHGWVLWQSQRGRGNRSTLQFLIDPEEIAAQSMMQAINRQDLRHAIEQIRVHARSSTMQDRLQEWLLTYFGHHAEIKSEKQIDTLRLPIRQQLHTVDPLYMNLLAESFVSSHIFDGLVRRSNNTHEILPNIAHAWEVDSSRCQWTFYLRKEVLFHHGTLMTAQDVVFTFERLIETSQRMLYSFIIKQIQSVRAINPTTVSITLKEPHELFLFFLCTSRATIVPQGLDQLGEHGFGVRPIGTGPFKVTEFNDSVCVLEVFPHYFQGRAHLDRVEIIQIPWSMGKESSDQIEPISPFHIIHNHASGAESSWSQIHSGASVRKFITCNTKKEGPLNDPNLRAHMLSCLRGEPIHLAQGVIDPQPVHLQIATIPQYRQDAHVIAESLANFGYVCKVVSTSVEEFKGSIRLESDLIVFSLIRDQDEQLRLFDLYLTMTDHVEPHTRVDIETTLHQVSRESEPQVRTQLFQSIENRLIQEHQLHILYEKPVQTAYLPTVRGVTFNSQGWVDLRHIWFPPI
ncbi:ABC transporter substrate-binding protein [Paenibacillus crassostreae]|uniref:ABC transporter substrate-binding protein n=1 Tax=Paenibacillus crassostreae TaxID=1763538 RepID=A0A162KPN3_9BACL|nr:ABC transporter substrate-binding protein [Paenibacillus crassostreae]AOZ93049.1 ABC transporter substrate-binding protein [Paenibacillus crassostreae]OAB71863.1 ABC transporter substrate-binding protein [Paenibacillus crassostreae]